MKKNIIGPPIVTHSFLLILSDNMIHNMGSQLGGSYEILYYKRTGHGMWLQVTDIRNKGSQPS